MKLVALKLPFLMGILLIASVSCAYEAAVPVAATNNENAAVRQTNDADMVGKEGDFSKDPTRKPSNIGYKSRGLGRAFVDESKAGESKTDEVLLLKKRIADLEVLVIEQKKLIQLYKEQ